ncbi:MAG: hypothetical protein KGY75_07485 [Candidatus Cloacimonetes bacterium]|nr:hypothetical protein [Candidatus Cloacimonadota bacterium]MBS3767946.1 hypothetical protein [Candidatus Cloacimonadota bacterium]
MGKHSIKIIIFLLLVSIFLAACCQNPPPPIKKSQIEGLRARVQKLEGEVNDQNNTITTLEQEMSMKEAELQALKDCKEQLIKEGYLTEE